VWWLFQCCFVLLSGVRLVYYVDCVLWVRGFGQIIVFCLGVFCGFVSLYHCFFAFLVCCCWVVLFAMDFGAVGTLCGAVVLLLGGVVGDLLLVVLPYLRSCCCISHCCCVVCVGDSLFWLR